MSSVSVGDETEAKEVEVLGRRRGNAGVMLRREFKKKGPFKSEFMYSAEGDGVLEDWSAGASRSLSIFQDAHVLLRIGSESRLLPLWDGFQLLAN